MALLEGLGRAKIAVAKMDSQASSEILITIYQITRRYFSNNSKIERREN
jgi:hypothetical protein